MLSVRAFLVASLVLIGVALLSAPACTPAQREAAVVPATRLACIIIRAIAQDGTVDEVCATAEDLAPFVVEILSSVKPEESAKLVTEAARGAHVVAFSLAPPPRRVPRRRCAQWVSVSASSIQDAAIQEGGSADGSTHD